jgi:hypothetical protein
MGRGNYPLRVRAAVNLPVENVIQVPILNPVHGHVRVRQGIFHIALEDVLALDDRTVGIG